MNSEITFREHIVKVVLERFEQPEEGRREALREYLATARPDVNQDMAQAVAVNAPALLPDLYAKWAGMFVDRLMETVPGDQVEYLCDGDKENNAALALAFIMFLESERMEKQMDEDLRACERFADGSPFTAVRDFIIGAGRDLARIRQQEQQTKAAAYKAGKKS